MCYRRGGKRAFDLLVVMPTLLVLLPLGILISFLVYWRLGTPILFRQRRPGKNGRAFIILKFRTMTSERDDSGVLLPDEKRLTPFGRFLRCTSLDELPELINVLKGEMSLVGPRPLLIRYQSYFTKQEMERFDVLPGITGWAQVNGRNEMTWDSRLAHDVWYASNQSIALDLKILGLTCIRVLQRRGVQVSPRSTMLDLDEERGTR